MFRTLIAFSIVILLPNSGYAACASDDYLCQQAQSDLQRQDSQAAQQRTDQLNQQNGTSQYSGPSCYTTASGNQVCGYQQSTP
ncbi:hypothetical protein AU381_16760 [Sinorhizobium glycinis]|uniref:Uncharacterized protein n=1 Tax=Sinorhizobium glycinis TaxID=1472378 RepID=A0A178XM03_9HYPH|nr:hypothetical protein [Sinorhizobium glycinis]OAP35833.1 hypothetical protein AU381_16760 [Sinorhizobium glycinis]